MKEKLKLVRELQAKHKDLHLCGSLALIVLGKDIGREVGDIDFVKESEENPIEEMALTNHEGSSDMRFSTIKEGFKIEVAIFPEVPHYKVDFEGHTYSVSSYVYILGWKMLYALKGSQKHIKDIKYLMSKVKPKSSKWSIAVKTDDIPF